MKTRFYFCYLAALASTAIGLTVVFQSDLILSQEPDKPAANNELEVPDLPSIENPDYERQQRELRDAKLAIDRAQNDLGADLNIAAAQQESASQDSLLAAKRAQEQAGNLLQGLAYEQAAARQDAEKHYSEQRDEYSEQANRYREQAKFDTRGSAQWRLTNEPNNFDNRDEQRSRPRFSPEMQQIQDQLSRSIQDLNSGGSDEQKAKLKEEITAQLTAQYDLYLEQHAAPLKELEARLEKLKTEFEWRKKAKEELIKLRVDTIWYESQGLGWPGGQPNNGANISHWSSGPSVVESGGQPNNGANISRTSNYYGFSNLPREYSDNMNPPPNRRTPANARTTRPSQFRSLDGLGENRDRDEPTGIPEGTQPSNR